MWNRNFNNLLASHFGIKVDGYVDGGTAIKAFDGLSYNYSPHYFNYSSGSYSTTYYWAYRNMPLYNLFNVTGTVTALSSITAPTLMVGGGVSAESYDDYTINVIEGQSHIGHLNGSVTFDNETRTWSVEITRVFRNSSGETVTVSELGLFVPVVTAYNSTKVFMVQRKLLDEPITVENNKVYSVTMYLTYSDKYTQNDGTVRNFDNIIVSILKGSTSSGYADGYTSVKNASGTQLSAQYNALMKLMGAVPYNKSTTSNSTDLSFMTIVGGSGTVANSYEDYKVTEFSSQSHITSTLDNVRYDSGSHSWVASVTRTLQNNSGAEITVREIGLYATLGNSSQSISGGSSSKSNGWSTYFALIQRKVLDTPLVVPAGSIYTLSMDIRFSEQR